MNMLWDATRFTYRGARILAVLAVAGRNPSWLRRATGLGINTIGRLLEDTQQTPTPRTLRAAARALHVSAEWLDPDDARRALTPTETEEMRKCERVLRAIAGGKRIDARKFPNVRVVRTLSVPDELRARGACDVYRVVGDSLAGLGLIDRDLAYVRPAGKVRTVVGSLVVVGLNEKLYLKRVLVAPRGVVMLVSAADGYEPIVVRKRDSFTLLGEVVASAREYGTT